MAGALLIIGSVVFLIGAAVGVPRVFGTVEPAARSRLLAEHATAWRIAQPLYATGPVVAAIGIVVLSSGGTAFLVAGVLMLAGAMAWSYSCYRRGRSPADFAFGRLPRWPFATYVLLTIAGLAITGAALIDSWLGWVVLAADALFLAFYLVTRDIPPFVFYLLLILAGVVVAG